MYAVFVASSYNKLLFCFLLLLFPVTILAQDKYHVVDAETGEALDGVCMYVTEGKGAWTNENGDAELLDSRMERRPFDRRTSCRVDGEQPVLYHHQP